MSDTDLKRRMEAVLFAADAPVDMGRLIDIFSDASRGDIREAISELNDEYDRDAHSFNIVEIGGGWQMYCRADYQKWVRELHKGRMATRLSQAALETLAIVAYKQPLVRAEIEMIRGVDTSGVLATLLKRNLVTIAGRAPGMGRALMYGTTKEFLRYFGLNSVTDLPRLEEFAEVLGLKPDELEMAVEGAESLSGMVGEEEPADDAGPADDAEPTDDAGPPDHEGEFEEHDQETGSPEDLVAEPVRALVASGPGTIHGATVSETAPGEDRHHLRDSDLIESLDED